MGFLFDMIVAYWWIILIAVVAIIFGIRMKKGGG